MLEREFETHSETNIKDLVEERNHFYQQIKKIEQDKENYTAISQKQGLLISLFYSVIICCYVLPWEWTRHLPVGAASPNHWTEADANFRHTALSFIECLIGLFTGGVLGLATCGIISFAKHHTRKFKHFLINKKQIEQSIENNIQATQQAFDIDKNRFDLLWFLENTVHTAQKTYSPEFLSQYDFTLLQLQLERAYVNNDYTGMEACMAEIYAFPESLEEKWQEFNAQKIVEKKHQQMKENYAQYLKKEGKPAFTQNDLNSIVRQTL